VLHDALLHRSWFCSTAFQKAEFGTTNVGSTMQDYQTSLAFKNIQRLLAKAQH